MLLLCTDKMERRTLVLVSLVSLSTGQSLLSITQHPRDTHVAPGGTVSSLNWLKGVTLKPPPPQKKLKKKKNYPAQISSRQFSNMQASLPCGHTVPPSLAARGLRVSWFREGVRLLTAGGEGPNSAEVGPTVSLQARRKPQ